MSNQKLRVLGHLQQYGSITQLEALQMYGIGRLAARIHELRYEGVNISKVMIEDLNRYGEVTRYAKYIYGGV